MTAQGTIERALLLTASVAAVGWLAVSLSDVHKLDHAQRVVSSMSRSPAEVHRGLRLVNAAGRLNPDRASLLLTKASLLGLAGRAAESRAALEQATRLEPANLRAWGELAIVTNKTDPAVHRKAVAKVLQLDPIAGRRR